MKFCKDCRYWMPKTTGYNQENIDECLNPKVNEPPGISMVTGEPFKPKTMFAESVRKYGICGEEATLFEPRLPLQAKEVASK